MISIKEIIIGVMLFLTIILGSFYFAEDLSQTSGIKLNSSNYTDSLYDSTTNITQSMNTSYSDIRKTFEADNEAGFFTGLVSATTLLKDIIVLPFAAMSDSIDFVAFALGTELPPFVNALLVVLITVMIVFGFVAAVLRFTL